MKKKSVGWGERMREMGMRVERKTSGGENKKGEGE